MADDYSYGNGAKIIEDIDVYFNSRDFTMNQVFVSGGTIKMTEQAAFNLRNKVIRPTAYEHDDESGRRLSSKLALKALLLASVSEEERGEAHIRGFNPATAVRGDLFRTILCLQKSLEYGDGAAKRFREKLHYYGVLNDNEVSMPVHDLTDKLNNQLELPFGFSGKALHAIERSRSEFFWTMRDDDVEQWRNAMLAYRGRGSKYANESKY